MEQNTDPGEVWCERCDRPADPEASLPVLDFGQGPDRHSDSPRSFVRQVPARCGYHAGLDEALSIIDGADEDWSNFGNENDQQTYFAAAKAALETGRAAVDAQDRLLAALEQTGAFALPEAELARVIGEPAASIIAEMRSGQEKSEYTLADLRAEIGSDD